MRHHSAALSLDQTLQDLADAHALLRDTIPILRNPSIRSILAPRSSINPEELLSRIERLLPPPPSPPAEDSEWRLSPSGLLVTVLGCVRPSQPLVVYQHMADDSSSIMDLHEFLQLATSAQDTPPTPLSDQVVRGSYWLSDNPRRATTVLGVVEYMGGTSDTIVVHVRNGVSTEPTAQHMSSFIQEWRPRT